MIKRILPPGFLCLSVLAQINPVSAQELAALQLDEADFFTDFPVVLTATRLKQPQKDSPIATTIIDREMIDASGFTEIPDLLRLAPGMLVNYDSGHVIAAGYQFLFSRYTVRMQILVDGRSVYTPLFGEMPWTQLGITIDDIERIEVIRGPSSSSYGPNAMTGVISIITRHASLDKGIKIKTNRNGTGLSEQFFTLGNNTGDFDYKLSLATRKDDGFELRHDGKELSLANFRGDYQVTRNDTLTFNVTYNSGDYQEDNTFDPILHPDHIKKVLGTSHQVKWAHLFKNGDDFSINYYQQKYEDRNKYDAELDLTSFVPGLIVPGVMDESVRTDRQNLEFAHSIYSDMYNFSWGIILRKDKTVAPQYLYQSSKDSIDTKQLFINSEFILNKKNRLNLGLLADNNDTAGTTYSPRVSLNHHINENNTLRVSYAQATRSPFIFEEYTNYVVPDFSPTLITLLGDDVIMSDKSDLEPEKIKSFDIGYIAYLNNKKTVLDMRLFKNELSNLIITDFNFDGGAYQGDGFNITGLEASISHQMENTRIIFNYARTKIHADKLVIVNNPSWYETGAPEDNISLLAIHNFGNSLKGSLGYYYTGTYQQLCCEEELQTPRKRLDLTLSKAFKLGEYNSSIKLVLQNIMNEEVNARLLNNYDRQGYISFSMEL